MKKQEFTWDNRLTEMLNELKKSEKGTEDQSIKVRDIIAYLNKRHKEEPRG